jgi:hypothetical protein
MQRLYFLLKCLFCLCIAPHSCHSQSDPDTAAVREIDAAILQLVAATPANFADIRRGEQMVVKTDRVVYGASWPSGLHGSHYFLMNILANNKNFYSISYNGSDAVPLSNAVMANFTATAGSDWKLTPGETANEQQLLRSGVHLITQTVYDASSVIITIGLAGNMPPSSAVCFTTTVPIMLRYIPFLAVLVT